MRVENAESEAIPLVLLDGRVDDVEEQATVDVIMDEGVFVN